MPWPTAMAPPPDVDPDPPARVVVTELVPLDDVDVRTEDPQGAAGTRERAVRAELGVGEDERRVVARVHRAAQPLGVVEVEHRVRHGDVGVVRHEDGAAEALGTVRTDIAGEGRVRDVQLTLDVHPAATADRRVVGDEAVQQGQAGVLGVDAAAFGDRRRPVRLAAVDVDRVQRGGAVVHRDASALLGRQAEGPVGVRGIERDVVQAQVAALVRRSGRREVEVAVLDGQRRVSSASRTAGSSGTAAIRARVGLRRDAGHPAEGHVGLVGREQARAEATIDREILDDHRSGLDVEGPQQGAVGALDGGQVLPSPPDRDGLRVLERRVQLVVARQDRDDSAVRCRQVGPRELVTAVAVLVDAVADDVVERTGVDRGVHVVAVDVVGVAICIQIPGQRTRTAVRADIRRRSVVVENRGVARIDQRAGGPDLLQVVVRAVPVVGERPDKRIRRRQVRPAQDEAGIGRGVREELVVGRGDPGGSVVVQRPVARARRGVPRDHVVRERDRVRGGRIQRGPLHRVVAGEGVVHDLEGRVDLQGPAVEACRVADEQIVRQARLGRDAALRGRDRAAIVAAVPAEHVPVDRQHGRGVHAEEADGSAVVGRRVVLERVPRDVQLRAIASVDAAGVVRVRVVAAHQVVVKVHHDQVFDVRHPAGHVGAVRVERGILDVDRGSGQGRDGPAIRVRVVVREGRTRSEDRT